MSLKCAIEGLIVAAFVSSVGGVGNGWRGFGVDGPELGDADLARGLWNDTRTKQSPNNATQAGEEGVPGRK